jgi:plasmid replication initiation protein
MSKRAEEIVTEHTKDFWDGEYDARERAALVAAINQAFQEACRAVCDDCAKGVPLSDPEHHTEAGGFYPCDAAPIRRLMCPPPGERTERRSRSDLSRIPLDPS